MTAPASATSHDKRVQKYAYGSLAAALVLGAVLVAQGDGRLAGLVVPAYMQYLSLAVALALGLVGISRRSDLFGALSAGALVLAVLPGGVPSPSLGLYALGALFGLALLLTLELIHTSGRYERAHRAVETENVPEEHINRVTDEALKTLGVRAALAFAAVGLAFAVALALGAWGPRQWQAAVETTAPLGVSVIALALAGSASLFILARGAEYRLRRESPPKELLPDVAE